MQSETNVNACFSAYFMLYLKYTWYFTVSVCVCFKVQKLQEAAEVVKSRCKNLLHENNLIIKNKNKKLEKVSLKLR